ncbi:SSA2 [Mytilus edulis]|uniref:TROVE2 n=1 Tax=Mytilus edulis TaxID=6550 RepID=A0A8S3SJE0_MYTED|nr:SSA2 [Mytilus edulis]
MFAYAVCIVDGDGEVRNYGYKMLNNICRIPTHLFEFQNYCAELNKEKKELNKEKNIGSGWGRSHRIAISKWYNNFSNNAPKLAYLVTKYKKRSKWNHRDMVRLAHVKPKNEKIRTILKFIVNKEKNNLITLHDSDDKEHAEVKTFLGAVIEAKKCKDNKRIQELVAENDLAREHLPNSCLLDKKVWQTLLVTMPLTAMIRNIGKMTHLGIFSDEHASFHIELVKERLQIKPLQASKVHPLKILFALRQYQAGKGDQGKLSWKPNHGIVSIMEEAFDNAVGLQTRTGKRYLLAVSVSGDMKKHLVGSPLTASEAAAAMVHTIAKREQDVKTLFVENKCDVEQSFVSTIDQYDNLSSIRSKLDKFSSPEPTKERKTSFKEWASSYEKFFDVIMIFTDTLTGEGKGRVVEPFVHHCHRVGAPSHARVIVAMTGKPNDRVEPCDDQTLRVIGFDQSTPQIINAFIDNFRYNDASVASMDGVVEY